MCSLKDVASTNGVIESQYSVLYGAVAIIFIVSGLQLSPKKLRENLTNWRLHILTQGISFVVIPVIWLSKRHISIHPSTHLPLPTQPPQS